MTILAQPALDLLLEPFRQEILRVHRDQLHIQVLADAVTALWPYLTATPGEQFAMLEFAQMFKVSSTNGATIRLSKLVGLGILTRTMLRKGRGGGSGYVCPWLEARRSGGVLPLQPVQEVDIPDATDVESLGHELELAMLALGRSLAETHRLVGAESVTGRAITAALQEVGAHLNRARTCLAEDGP